MSVFAPEFQNSLFLCRIFLLGPRKFPVPMRREFSGKPLNLLADWAPKFEAEGRILQNSLFVSLLSGN